jgi:osmotically-inducible protein OsmY
MSEAATSLVERLDAAISSNPHLFGRDLRCSSHAGHVTLSGNVDTYFQKQMAQEAIRYVDGVQRIENRVEVTWA